MYNVKIGRDKNDRLTFVSSNGGKLVDVSHAPRSSMLDLNILTARSKPVFKSLYVLHHKIVVPMARMEDSAIDAVYVNKQGKHAIFVSPKCVFLCRCSVDAGIWLDGFLYV